MLSTVDTVGIPLMLLARGRAVRSPFVYVAIGLPERLAQLRSRPHGAALRPGARRGGRDRHLQPVRGGRDPELAARAGRQTSSVEFVPFGVDVEAFRPVSTPPDVDVVSIGARSPARLRAAARRRADAAGDELPRRHDGRSGALARRRGRRTSRSRPTCPSTRCAAVSSVRAWSLCRCATTATRVRRRCSSRRWRSRSRSSSLEPQRSRRATGSRTGSNVRLVRSGGRARLRSRRRGAARRRAGSQSARSAGAGDHGGDAHVGALRRSDRSTPRKRRPAPLAR